MGAYYRPTQVSEALALLGAGPVTIVAGGTDFYPTRVGRAIDEDMLDISGIASLRGIDVVGDAYRIGALATWSNVIAVALPACFDGLKLAAREVGGVQIQNTGTVVGNVCNASPAADGVPCLLALDAEIELASADGTRRLPLADFVTGNRTTVLRPEEFVAAIMVPTRGERARSTFVKLGARRYLVISIAMVAVTLELTADGSVGRARVAVGACSAVARRLTALEDDLVGRRPDTTLADVATAAHFSGLEPIDDVRGTAAYRRDAALTITRRALADVAGQLSDAA